jgi:drug/metabolite transporter (DMT)-like permease
VTLVVGAFEFVNVTIAVPSLYLFPAWIALVSVVLFVRRPGERADAPAAPRP